MKNIMFLLCAAILVCGCKKDDPKPEIDEPLWEFPPHNVCFILLDRAGNNFFDPEYENNILDRPIKIEYEGETYELNEYFEGQTRIIPPIWFGLREGTYIGYDGDDGTPALLFGEFPASYKSGPQRKEFTVDWGDGKTTSDVEFDYWLTWEFDKALGYDVPTEHRSIWVDGKLVNPHGLLATAVVSSTSGFGSSAQQAVVW